METILYELKKQNPNVLRGFLTLQQNLGSTKKNIYETIHDMGGNDTIDLSNYVWDMDIDLNPGSVSEVGVGQERMHWNSLRGEKTGDIFILSWETTIENYIGLGV